MPEFVTIGERSYEVLVVSRVVWLGLEYPARVCHTTRTVFLSGAFSAAKRRRLLRRAVRQGRRFLSRQWQRVY